MADKREIDSKIKKVAENHRQITTSLSTITEGAQALLKGMSVELKTEEIVVPEGVYHIPDNSFLFLSSSGNYALERVVFPTTLLSVGKNLLGLFGASPGAFFQEPELVIPTLYMWLAGALADVKPQFNFTTTFGDITDRIDPEDVPEGVSVIKEFAFYHNRFKQVALPDSVEVVDKYAFYGNHDLEALDLGGVSSVGDYAFAFNVKLACVEGRALTDISKYNMMVTFPFRLRIRSQRSLRASTSSPSVGSSRKRISGSLISAMAILSLRCHPPDNLPAFFLLTA